MPGRPKGMLVFDVTLYSFKATPQPPKAPADVGGVPPDAEVTASGLASRMLKAGTPGGAKPKSTDRVTVDYSGAHAVARSGWPPGTCLIAARVSHITRVRLDHRRAAL